MSSSLRHSVTDSGGFRLHVVDQGLGPAVLFCHGFPTTWLSWRSAMNAVAEAGFHAIAFDMRGYGNSDAPFDSDVYTPFHTVGDIIAILDHFKIQTAVVVGHDFGATAAWNAAMMRPDRIAAVFGVSVPFTRPGGPSFLDQLRSDGKTDFYMFDQILPEADKKWGADTKKSITSSLWWLSGEPAEAERWNPFDPRLHMLREAPHAPQSIDAAYVEAMIGVFGKTGFHAPLNYYRCIDAFLSISNRTFAGCVVKQPSFFLTGEFDGLNLLRNPTENSLRGGLPGLRGFSLLAGVGHWPQLEAAAMFNNELLEFLESIK